MKVLVTGGAGYIGSHACKRLLTAGHDVVILDNLSRGHKAAVDRLATMQGVDFSRITIHEGDVGDSAILAHIFSTTPIDAVMHFAALAYVRESVDEPLRYYANNTAAAVPLIEAVIEHNITRFVFSSTCATYGEPDPALIPIREDCPQQPINPYGWSKLFIERMILDARDALQRAGRPLPGIAMLRYFNVAGCDRSGLIGEDHDPETHLIPIILEVARGKRDALTIFGSDHATPDGTCVRDYIHVEDLVDAHAAVLESLKPGDIRAYNLGIGCGYSINDVIESARRVTGHPIPTKDGPRHPGDPPTLYCDPSRIKDELGWSASLTDLDDIIASAWQWFCANPRGYE